MLNLAWLSRRRFLPREPYPDPWTDNGAFDHRVMGRRRYDAHRPDRQIAVIFGGLGLAALGAKVNDASRPAPQTAKSTKAK